MGAAASCGAQRAIPPPPADAPLLQRSALSKPDREPDSVRNVHKGPEGYDKVSELPTRPRRSRRTSSFTEWAIGASWSKSGGDRDSSFRKKKRSGATATGVTQQYSIMSEHRASTLSIMAAADAAAASVAEPKSSIFGLAMVDDTGDKNDQNVPLRMRFEAAPAAAPAAPT